MAVYTGITGNTYNLAGNPFAGGGEGDIFNVADNPDLAAKIYNYDKRTTERERKLSAMVTIKPGLMDQYAWPLDVLYENGKFAGFVMIKITGKEKLRNIYVYDNRGGAPWTLYIAIAKNLSAAVSNVHEIKQIIGDLNPENILTDPKTGLVTLVDTDSYHIVDAAGSIHRCAVGMPEFVAPELQGIHFPSAPLPTFTIETDRFSLAELIFALIMNGAHPFACKTISGSSSKFQPIDNMVSGTCAYFSDSSFDNIEIPRYAPELNSLPEEIQSLFHRAFIEGHKNPAIRPAAEEWYYALERLEANIVTCGNDPEHLYYTFATKCPWCHIEEKMRSISQEVFTGYTSADSTGSSAPSSLYGPASSGSQNYSSGSFPQGSSPPQPGTKNNLKWTGWVIAACALLIIILIGVFNSSNSGYSSDYSPSYSSGIQQEPPAAAAKEPPAATTQPAAAPRTPPAVPQETYTEQFVHVSGLNVRSGPSKDHSLQFSLVQDEKVRVSNRGRSGDWVKIKYNNQEGYVNSQYLRDFRITGIDIGNMDQNTAWITRPGNTLYAYNMRYLGIEPKLDYLNSSGGSYTFVVKIYDPWNNLFGSWSSSFGAGGRSGWGNSNQSSYSPGTYYIELWYQSNSAYSDTEACIYTTSVYLY
jgi:serine/threonine protein kinase